MAISRRGFMGAALAAGTFSLLPGCRTFCGSKVRLACVGIGQQAWNDIREFQKTGLCEIVALCDTDLLGKQCESALKAYPDAPRFTDFRKMLDAMDGKIDAVAVMTPDFSHFPALMASMKRGLAVFSEKPLAHTFEECELLIAAAEKYGVVTQMGNQGHSGNNYYQFKHYVETGIIDISKLKKLTAHMNNPRRWHKWNGNVKGYPAKVERPEGLDWDTWLGTAAYHDFSHDYDQGEWRSWYDFGNGCLGDWGAHIFDGIHEFFGLGLPTEIAISDVQGWNPYVFPMVDTLTFKFAATAKRKALNIVWREGIGNYPELPKGFKHADGSKGIPTSGGQDFSKKMNLSAGKEIWMEDGSAWQGGSHASPLSLCGADKDVEIPDWEYRGGGCNWPNQHWENFLRAVRGEIKTTSNFEVAGPLSQVFTLGCIAQRLNRSLKFDPVKKEFVGDAEANALLAPAPRAGWEEYYEV